MYFIIKTDDREEITQEILTVYSVKALLEKFASLREEGFILQVYEGKSIYVE